MLRAQRISLPLTLAALAVLAAALSSGCASAPAEGPARPRLTVADCDEARSAAKTALASTLECEDDLDCLPFLEPHLGCDGVRSTRAPEPAGLEKVLLDACTGVPSQRLACPSTVAACVASTCQATPWPRQDCPAAEQALRMAAAAPVICQADADCGALRLGTSVHAVPAGFGLSAAGPLGAYERACGRKAFRVGRPDRVRCLDRVCALPAPAAPAPAKVAAGAKALGPLPARPHDPGCLAGEIRDRLAALGLAPPPKLEVTLLVGPDGRTGLFQASSEEPAELPQVVASAGLACRFDPAVDAAGRPMAGWLTMPLVLK